MHLIHLKKIFLQILNMHPIRGEFMRKNFKLFKLLALAIICIFIFSAFSACDKDKINDEQKPNDESKVTDESKAEDEKPSSDDYEKVEYENMENIGILPKDVQEKIEELKVKRGYTYFKIEDGYVIFISMGEKNTGGYSISVISVENVHGTARITVEEKSPEKNDEVTHAITYPYTIIKIKGVEKKFEVVTKDGEKFEFMPLEDDLQEYTGTYTGQIDNNSIEIIVDKNMEIDEAGSAAAFRLEGEIKEYFDSESKNFKGFKENEKVKFSFERNVYGQLILKMLERISDK